MRVLYVEGVNAFGGSLTGILHLVRYLPDDVKPILLTSYDPSAYTDMPPRLVHRKVDIPNAPKVCVGRVRGLLRYFRCGVRPWYQAVDKAIAEFKPDIIHANNTVTTNLGVALIGRKRRIPTISHQKGFEYPGMLNRWLVKHSRYSHHIATSGAIAKHLKAFGLDPRRCTTIYESVTGPSEAQLANARDNDVPIVAMHSMLTSWKGQHVFLRAVAEVRRRCDSPFQVIIAGTAPETDSTYPRELYSLVEELRLEDVVQFSGHLREVYDFLPTVDIAVHASIQPEPFGRVVPEAMLSGLPTIVTMDGGPAEYVHDGVTGLHVPRNDVPAMADAIERLVTSRELRQRMGRAAREAALEKLDPATLTMKVVEVYRQLLAGKKSPKGPAGG